MQFMGIVNELNACHFGLSFAKILAPQGCGQLYGQKGFTQDNNQHTESLLPGLHKSDKLHFYSF